MAIDLQAVIERAVRSALQPMRVDMIDVEERQDSIDEDAVYITVNLPPSTPLLGGEKYLSAMTAVSDALLEAGDRRFPYLRLHHEGEDMAVEPDRGEASTQ